MLSRPLSHFFCVRGKSVITGMNSLEQDKLGFPSSKAGDEAVTVGRFYRFLYPELHQSGFTGQTSPCD